ncbi:MAG: acetate kinase [bacterium]
MKILVINCGSSTLKFQLFDMENETALIKGKVEKIGVKGSSVRFRVVNRDVQTIEEDIPDHKKAFELMARIIVDPSIGCIKNTEEIDAIGHRVVHGGSRYTDSVIIDKHVMDDINEYSIYAPLHNPINLVGIESAKEIFPHAPNVAVFDTAFHHTMPRYAYIYGIPYELSEKYGIRRYGFHGTSHSYVAQRTAKILERPIEELKIVTCHIGNGTSITAVEYGKSIDTSMGMTPLQGIIMGTRSGTIDPSILELLMEKEGLNDRQLIEMLNKKSGLLGLSGISSDMRDLEAAARKGEQRALLALEVQAYQVKKFIGEYIFILNGVDAITFAGGVGENDWIFREEVCRHLEFMDSVLDVEQNRKMISQEGIISTQESKVKILVVPTNEELIIARETVQVVKRSGDL